MLPAPPPRQPLQKRPAVQWDMGVLLRTRGMFVDLGTGSCRRLKLRGNAITSTSHLLGVEFEDLVRYADRALTDGCRLQVALRVTARRPHIPLEGTVDGWCESASMPEPGLA